MTPHRPSSTETPASKSANRKSQVVDLVAVIAATCLASLGVLQLIAPALAAALTGIEAGLAGEILAVQWLLMAALLFVGGVLHMRVVTIFAAEFVVIGSLAAFFIALVRSPDAMPMFVHGAIVLLALGSSGFARLTDKAELKREVHLLREASLNSAAGSAEPAGDR